MIERELKPDLSDSNPTLLPLGCTVLFLMPHLGSFPDGWAQELSSLHDLPQGPPWLEALPHPGSVLRPADQFLNWTGDKIR